MMAGTLASVRRQRGVWGRPVLRPGPPSTVSSGFFSVRGRYRRIPRLEGFAVQKHQEWTLVLSRKLPCVLLVPVALLWGYGPRRRLERARAHAARDGDGHSGTLWHGPGFPPASSC